MWVWVWCVGVGASVDSNIGQVNVRAVCGWVWVWDLAEGAGWTPSACVWDLAERAGRTENFHHALKLAFLPQSSPLH